MMMRYPKKRRLSRDLDDRLGSDGASSVQTIPDLEIAHTNGQAEAIANSRAMVDTVNAVLRADSIPDIVRATLDTVRKSFGWAYASYWKVDEAQNALAFAF